MTRERLIEILASELEASKKLSGREAEFIAELRADKHGPGALEGAIRAMQRAADEALHTGG